MDWNKKPVQKSPEEIEFDKWNEAYKAMFGKPYVLQMCGGSTMRETIEDMQRCIATRKEQEPFEYDDDEIV